MTQAYTQSMTQAATYWAPGSNDGFGGTTFAAPVSILCRWQDQATLFRDTQGREVVSDAVVYPDRALAVGGRIALGSHEDANPVDSAKEIRQAFQSPSLSNTEVLHKVML